MNLPAIYEAVVAKRPDLAVKGLALHKIGRYSWWRFEHIRASVTTADIESIAAALIFDLWFKALPAGIRLYMCDGDIAGMPGKPQWVVDDHHEGTHWGLRLTPIEALASYHLENK